MERFKQIFDLDFIKAIEISNGLAYLVGGCVRDHFQGLEPKDIDIVVSNIPAMQLQMILSKYGKVDLVGESFGVFKFIDDQTGLDFDISIPRRDVKIEGAKGHKSIETQSDHMFPIEADLGRRDFTCNAIAINNQLTIIDSFEGQEDLYKGIIRCVTENTFVEDPLRLLRAVQFAARFNFEISDETFELIKNNKHLIKEITSERVLEEFKKVFDKNGNISYFAELLDKTGLFAEYFGYNINFKRIEPAQYLSEFLYYAIADFTFDGVENSVSDFYKKKLGSAMPIQLFKEIRAFDTIYTFSKDVTDRPGLYRLVFDAIKQSDIILRSEFLSLSLINPFLNGVFPKTRKEIALTGDDLIQLGWKEGKEVGQAVDKMLNGIFSRQVKNDKQELINFLNQK